MPQASQTAKHSSGSLKVIVLVCAALAVAAATGGFAYQSVESSRDRRANPMPGRLVDVGGYRMHIDCSGTGSPAVILDSGLGDGYLSWRKVQPQIAQWARACSYDRAGFGYSDSSPKPRTSKVFAEELHALLQNAGVPPPYVLVGHSMGGYDVRLYASLYPAGVAGMVLVDASHPEQQKRLPAALNDLDATWLREQELFEFTMPFGLPRERRGAEINFGKRCGNRRGGIAWRFAAHGYFARSGCSSIRFAGRSSEAYQCGVAAHAAGTRTALNPRHGGDRQPQRTLHSARPARCGDRCNSKSCRGSPTVKCPTPLIRCRSQSPERPSVRK